MTCTIERHADGQQTTLRLIGDVQAEHREALQAQVESHGPGTVLDLDEVTLVDVEVVHFLGGCEAAGITAFAEKTSLKASGTAVLVHGGNKMQETIASKNKALVLEAFDTLSKYGRGPHL